jgi:uncharacterized membrane protein YqaE (UPF0057 family)
MSGVGDVLLLILALFFPPIAVLIKDGCHFPLCLNILLTLLGWLPGMILIGQSSIIRNISPMLTWFFLGVIHAWYVIVASKRHRHH